jgi:hypothetical protein
MDMPNGWKPTKPTTAALARKTATMSPIATPTTTIEVKPPTAKPFRKEVMGNLKEQSLSDCRSFLATQSIKLFNGGD